VLIIRSAIDGEVFSPVSLSVKAALRRPAILSIAGLTLVAGTIGTAIAQAQTGPAASTALYIVQLTGAPLASYQGGDAGYAATRPAVGSKLDAHSTSAQAYRGHLKDKQTSVLRGAGIDPGRTVYQYQTAFNGVAVKLTALQAQKMAHAPGVLHVFKSRIVHVDTPITPRFVGLTGNDGVWKRQFGGDRNAGNGVIIADLDTGFWPESPSFKPLPSPRPDDKIIAAKWKGTCDAGADKNPANNVTCNNKVIGARWFNAAGVGDAFPGEFHSPRDYDGHGSHTASTAAGDYVPSASVNGVPVGDLEGMAPGARLAIYKVLWETGSGGSGSDVDIVAAIDQAVADGADVINFSIGDNLDGFGPDELAFMQAAAAGVFVSAAAGNAGPGPSTVDNAMPWETTVAAGTHDIGYSKSATLGNGTTYTGVGVGAAVPSAALIDSATAAKAPASVSDATLCKLGSLDPALVTGKIVLCQRGQVARTDKSQAVKDAGGVGMILWNAAPNSLNADFHVVPTVHVDTAAGQAIKAYIAGTTNPTASLSAGVQVKQEAPTVADFSSRGPSISSGGDVIKPDILAPGNDVIASVSPAGHNGNIFDSESGTSMATPHITGLAALLMSKHPDWSPMWVKSALMTTASTTDNKGKAIPGTPLDFGSGEVNPAASFNPGLVYDSSPVDWIAYSCGIGVHLQMPDGSDSCDAVPAIAPNQLNYPSIAFGSLAGTDTVTRTVTNTRLRWALYFADVKAPAGYKVKVDPPVLFLRPGGTATFKVTVTRTTAAFGSYSFGKLTWRSFDGGAVTSPIAVQSVALAAPGEVTGSGASGNTAIPLRSGYTGTLHASGVGLTADTVSPLSLTADPAAPFDSSDPKTSDRTGRVDLTVPDGTALARFATFASDYAPGTDIDVYVYSVDSTGGLTLVRVSGSSTADESVTLAAPGTYAVFVDLFANPSTGALPVKLRSWNVPPTLSTGFAVSPASQPVTLGKPATVTASWTGLDPAHHYLGIVSYDDGTGDVGATVIAVNP
jgi:subtilisin family serine protease